MVGLRVCMSRRLYDVMLDVIAGSMVDPVCLDPGPLCPMCVCQQILLLPRPGASPTWSIHSVTWPIYNHHQKIEKCLQLQTLK